MKKLWAVLVVFVLLAACSSKEPPPEPTQPPTPCQANGGENQTDDPDASSPVERPRAGDYVYDFCGLGETRIGDGTQLTEHIAVEGDIYIVDVTNNRNKNTRRYRLRWEEGRVVQLSNVTNIGGSPRGCAYEPPIENIPIPLKVHDLPPQTTGNGACEQTLDISVVGRATVEDATGKKWATWIIDYEAESGSRTDQERHWLSPELGHDVRVETTSQSQGNTTQTAQLLRSYPRG